MHRGFSFALRPGTEGFSGATIERCIGGLRRSCAFIVKKRYLRTWYTILYVLSQYIEYMSLPEVLAEKINTLKIPYYFKYMQKKSA